MNSRIAKNECSGSSRKRIRKNRDSRQQSSCELSIYQNYNIEIISLIMKKQCLKHHSYESIRKIGKGNFGQVQLVKSLINHNLYIIKKLPLQNENKHIILKQIKLMRKLMHQYIIRYFQSFIDSHNNVCIVMEYAEGGDLQAYLQKRKKHNSPLSQEEIIEWFTQLCLGIKYIHNQKVLHRDLKGQNIFITSQNQLKIGDFGISKIMKETFDMAKTKIGTPHMMAPQIWQNKKYNQKSDIWSLGCILYKMMTLRHAFDAQNFGARINKITSANYMPINNNYSSQLKQILIEMLQLNPLDRPSVHTILEKDIIKKNLGFVLNNSLRKFEESLPGLNNSKKLSRESSSHRKILQKKSLYSLSSSMLTNKNTNTTMKSGYDSMKMVEMKQSYPILQEQIKHLKKQEKRKQIFEQETNALFERMNEEKMEKQQLIQMFRNHVDNYFYPS